MRLKSGNVLIIPLIIAVIALFTATCFFLQNRELQKPKVETVVSAPTPVVKDETENWKTYTNKADRYLFKYPDDCRILEKDGKVCVENDKNFSCIISFEKKTNYPTMQAGDGKSFNGYEATKYEYEDVITRLIYMRSDKGLKDAVEIIHLKSHVADQILGTFRFLN